LGMAVCVLALYPASLMLVLGLKSVMMMHGREGERKGVCV
jgi:hypothetical protein